MTRAAGFSFTVTCQSCGGPLELQSRTTSRQTRRALTVCASCGLSWTLTVSMTRTVPASPAGGPRLPWAPLGRFLPERQGDAAALLGMSVQVVRAWQSDGVPADAADRLAVKAGVPPIVVWGQAYYVATGTCEGDEGSDFGADGEGLEAA